MSKDSRWLELIWVFAFLIRQPSKNKLINAKTPFLPSSKWSKLKYSNIFSTTRLPTPMLPPKKNKMKKFITKLLCTHCPIKRQHFDISDVDAGTSLENKHGDSRNHWVDFKVFGIELWGKLFFKNGRDREPRDRILYPNTRAIIYEMERKLMIID